MNEFLNARYTKLGLLALGFAVLIYIVQLIVFATVGIDFPQGLRVLLSVLGSGILVYKYFSNRIF